MNDRVSTGEAHPAGKPTVFLDIDGVLNSVAWAEGHFENGRPTRGGFIPPHTAELAIEERRIDPACVHRLRRLVLAAGAQLVISSSWRTRMPLTEWPILFERLGWLGAHIAGMTPVRPGVRGNEIQAWLDEAVPGTRYCILDDDDDLLETQRLQHVRTDPDVGLTDEDVLRCVYVLTGVALIERAHVLQEAERVFASRTRAESWMACRIEECGSMTADELVSSGRGDVVLKLLLHEDLRFRG